MEISDLTKETLAAGQLCALFAELLKTVRLKKNMTQRELSKKSGISRGKIMEAERGFATTPTLAAIVISLALDAELKRVLMRALEIHAEPKKIKIPKPRQRASGAVKNKNLCE